ncbi:MAG: hypothetical protein ACI906_004028 [Candidatus Latescibacterota bacterium]|jgi:hypothetical protein
MGIEIAAPEPQWISTKARSSTWAYSGEEKGQRKRKASRKIAQLKPSCGIDL